MNLKELNSSHYIATGLDGRGTIAIVPLEDMCEGNSFNLSLPEGTESVIMYVSSITEQCEEVVFHCIDNSIPVKVKYCNRNGIEEVYEFGSRGEAASILDSIQGKLGGVVNV